MKYETTCDLSGYTKLSINYLQAEVGTANGYPKRLVSRLIQEQKSNSIPCPEDLVRTFFECLEPTEPLSGHAVLPYIKGLTEPLTRVLRKHDIKVCNRPLKSLQHDFPSVKHRPPPEEQTNVEEVIADVIDKGNFQTRKTLESRHTAFSDQADNNSKLLPGQYTMLTKKPDKLLHFFVLLPANNLWII